MYKFSELLSFSNEENTTLNIKGCKITYYSGCTYDCFPKHDKNITVRDIRIESKGCVFETDIDYVLSKVHDNNFMLSTNRVYYETINKHMILIGIELMHIYSENRELSRLDQSLYTINIFIPKKIVDEIAKFIKKRSSEDKLSDDLTALIKFMRNTNLRKFKLTHNDLYIHFNKPRIAVYEEVNTTKDLLYVLYKYSSSPMDFVNVIKKLYYKAIKFNK